MNTINKPTRFASAAKDDLNVLEFQNELFSKNKSIVDFSNSISDILLVLNDKRQIIYANKLFINFMGAKTISEIIGRRPGEALECLHSINDTGGCGTTEFCKKCGAVNAILDSYNGESSIKECRITNVRNDAFDLEITATPFEIEQTKYTIFSVKDISNEKRRKILERVFFHDILNSAGGIYGLSEILNETDDEEQVHQFALIINRTSKNLLDDIQAQRQITAAERGELQLNLSENNSLTILNEIKELYDNHELTTNKTLQISSASEQFTFITDAVLLRRILGNMTKNAIEASLPNQTITLSSKIEQDNFILSVHNPIFIPTDVQLQLFKRSFSTKGNGRGIGTYSMKLFGEKYLKGKVWFESTENRGTTFSILIPSKISS